MSTPKIIDMTDQEIFDYFTKTLPIRNSEKDRFGEVFTPPDLINELLDNLPNSVWDDPTHKWLDPAAGKGNFSAFVYIRLLKSLSYKIPNIQERKTHILDNMLYMVELNPTNVREIKKMFGTKSNISLANFLEQSDKWKSDLAFTFTVIIGNPPFQMEKKATYEGSAGNRTLWDKFVTMILSPENNILSQKGYLAFITPAGWRRPENTLYDLMTKQNRLLFLHIYSKKSGQDKFGVETRFDMYIIQHLDNRSSKYPKIIDEMGKIHHNIDPYKWPFLPNYAYDKIRRILVDPTRGIPILFNSSEYDARKLSKRKTIRNRYPVVHGITQKGLGIQYAKNRNLSRLYCD